MEKLKAGVIGCGFFAQNHLAAWDAIEDVSLIAVCDQQAARAEEAKPKFGAERAYTDAEKMLEAEALDFVDVVTTPPSHRSLVELVARYGRHVICQKPLAPSLEDATAMVDACKSAGVTFMVHENFRWQGTMQRAKQILDAGTIGEPFFAQISFRTGYNVYPNQPYLATDERLVLYDMGVHIFDLVRFFMGEVNSLYAQTHRVKPEIRGEDVATALLRHDSGTSVTAMNYVSAVEHDESILIPVRIEGSRGSLEIHRDYQLNVVSDKQLKSYHVSPVEYSWGSSLGAAIMESVMNIQRHWVECLRNGTEPQTSGADNLKTLELVFGSYQSAAVNMIYHTR
jgi:D-apiose dehydrogenase